MAPNFWDTFRRHLRDATRPNFSEQKAAQFWRFPILVPHVIYIFTKGLCIIHARGEWSIIYSLHGVVHGRGVRREWRASRTGPLAWKRQNWLDFGRSSFSGWKPSSHFTSALPVRHLICACNIIYRKCTNNERMKKKTCFKLFTIHYYFLGFSFL